MSETAFLPHVIAACEAASAADRAWFKANPDRSHRIRRAFFGETPQHPDLLGFVVVRQVALGVRVRALYLRQPPSPPHEATEDEAASLFRKIMDSQPQGWGFVGAMEQIAREGQR